MSKPDDPTRRSFPASAMPSDRDVERLRAVVSEDTFSGRFDIVREAGEGGMGRVFEAIDRERGDRVAIKVLTSVSDRARFAAEAEVLERLTHAAIVRYVRHGTTTRGEPYLAMEWLVGENLAARLARGPLGVLDTVRLGARMADALDHAHRAGIVHRDLKPSNIFLVDHTVEHAHLIDFGVAKLVDSDLTQTGQLIGTPGYMAPEQVRGERTVDHRVDLFALGCVLYESLVGRAPFEGAEVMEVLARLLLEAPTPLPVLVDDVPPRLVHLVESLLSKDRTHRLGAAAVARDELTAIHAALTTRDTDALEQRPAYVPLPSRPDITAVGRGGAVRPRHRTRGRRWLAPAIAGAAVLVVAILALLFVRGPRRDTGLCTLEDPAVCASECDRGNRTACRVHAEVLHRGLGVPVDHEAGRVWDARGCEYGHGPSCFELGKSLRGVITATGLPLDDPRTQRRLVDMTSALQRGCDAGVWDACRSLGREYSGFGKTLLPYDAVRSFALVERACANLDVTACNALQDMIDDARHPPSLRDAAKPVRAAACQRLSCR